MFRLLATTKCKRQQIAILIISFFAYVAGIRNEGNNMLLQQQQTPIENSNYKSSMTDVQQPTTSNFRPSPIIDFTPADAAVPQNFKPIYKEPQHSIANVIATYTNSNNNNNNIPQKQETQNDNRRYTFETAAMATYGNVGEKQISFPNEQQQIPQHLTDKPIYIYRDPYTNENYHYTPTEANVPTTTSTYSYNNYYNNNGYKQQDSLSHQHHHSNNDDNQEYLVQSSMIVGSHQQQQQQSNPFRPYMRFSDDKDMYIKRPGFVYDEKPSYNHPNSVVIDKKNEETQTLKANKISYDSHDYPPPSYYQQQTSNFLPTPLPTTVRPTVPPTPPPPPKPEYRPPTSTQSSIFGQQQPQLQYLQSSQPSSLPNYVNNIDNYLLNKQQPNDYFRREVPPSSYYQQYQQQQQLQYETRPSYEYDARPQYSPPPPPPPASYQQHSQPQYVTRPPPPPLPSYNPTHSHYPQHETSRPPPPPPGRPSYNNYYDYQIGEIPPPASQQQFNYPYPRPPNSHYPYQGPYRPPHLPPPAQQSGLASLVQYAPQFTSLLLSGVGGGGGGSNSNNPLGSLIGALTGTTTSQQSSLPPSSYNRRPVNSQLIKALENIARNDDLQCVPKVLCQMIASQTQRGQLPTFITSPAISNFLAGFPAASPALIYGRAALLGLTGGEKTCHQTYVKCPKDEYEIIYYLNNHRGGFFKLFSEPDEQQQSVNHDSTQQGATSLFSILAALAGTPQATTTTPRPTPKPQASSIDITSGIGNFFTQLLSDYMGGATVEYQRRFKRRTKRSLNGKIKFEDGSRKTSRDIIKFEDGSRELHSDVLKFKDEDYDINEKKHQDTEEDFHDEEDDEDTQQGVEFKDDEDDYLDDTESRIIHKSGGRGNRVKFFPEIRETSDEIDKEEEIKKLIKRFNDFNRERKLKFPTATDERLYIDADQHGLRQSKLLKDNNLSYEQQTYGPQFNNYVENSYENLQKESKKIKFFDDEPSKSQYLYSYYLQTPKETKTKLVFPQRDAKILNRPYYAASYLQDYLQQQHLEQEEDAAGDDKFVISNSQRPLHYTEFSSAPSLANIYKTHINSLLSQNSFTSNAAVNNNIYVASPPTNTYSNNNHFLPTPAPPDNDFTAANSIYSSNDYSENQYNYNSLKQTTFYKPQRYPSTSSSTPTRPFYSGGSNNFYKPQRYPTSNSQVNYNRYHSSIYTTRRPYVSVTTTRKSNDDKNIYVTNSRGVTEYYITPDGRKVYL
ncbi:uncharacterized protein ACRADG_002686 isoform 2-T6 [Cochliomyia hominivorax]